MDFDPDKTKLTNLQFSCKAIFNYLSFIICFFRNHFFISGIGNNITLKIHFILLILIIIRKRVSELAMQNAQDVITKQFLSKALFQY